MTLRRVVAVIGQSNERGHITSLGTAVGLPQVSTVGPYTEDPLRPNGAVTATDGGYYGSNYPYIASTLYAEGRGWNVFRNCAVGGTGIVADWCGDAGSGVPATSADGAWDPNGHIATAVAELSHGDFDERVAVIAFGQTDAAAGVSASNYAQAHINLAEYLLSLGEEFRVFLGFTCYQPSAASWFANSGSVGVASALSYFAGDPRVFAGANLYEALGTTVGLKEGTHMDERAFHLAAKAYVAAFVAAGW